MDIGIHVFENPDCAEFLVVWKGAHAELPFHTPLLNVQISEPGCVMPDMEAGGACPVPPKHV